jgi:hypothetical protein
LTQAQQTPSPAMMEVITRSMANPEFRESMVSDPQEALKSAGINLSEEELQGITSSSREQREQLMQQLGDRSSQLNITFFQQFTTFFQFDGGFPFFGGPR